MAIPRVFVSSTCYDLKYIRENLKFFIGNMGFEAVLSEEGNVFYNPKLNVQDACLEEVPTCQIFVLIIGGRFGSNYRESPNSITNEEYWKAVKSSVPIFALVDQAVYSQYFVYIQNKENPEIDASKINYPAVDSIKIFNFMEEIQNTSKNNALVPFRDYTDLETYLKQQWAGMMYNFLMQQGESERVANTLSTLTEMSDRIEFLSKQILASVGKNINSLNVKIYNQMLGHDSITDLGYFGIKSTPLEIVKAKTYDEVTKGKLKIIDREGLVKISTGEMSRNLFKKNSEDFLKLKEEIQAILTKADMTTDEFIEQSEKI